MVLRGRRGHQARVECYNHCHFSCVALLHLSLHHYHYNVKTLMFILFEFFPCVEINIQFLKTNTKTGY